MIAIHAHIPGCLTVLDKENVFMKLNKIRVFFKQATKKIIPSNRCKCFSIGGNVAPEKTVGHIWRHFGCQQLVGGSDASGIQDTSKHIIIHRAAIHNKELSSPKYP